MAFRPTRLQSLLLLVFVSKVHALSSSTTEWYPRRIQESVEYDKVVPSAYVRHALVETKEMARTAVQLYLESQEPDAFGEMVKLLSVCEHSKMDGGKVGWIENSATSNEEEHSILPREIQEALFSKSPKAGDVHILESNQGQVHVVKVEELAVLHRPTSASNSVLGGHAGRNALVPRSKLKGQGVTPEMPTQFQTYSIHTSGCQMNVADTERLAGVLQHELHLTPATTETSRRCDFQHVHHSRSRGTKSL